MEIEVSLYLDKRSKRNNGEHPIKLRVYSSLQQKAKLYGLKESATTHTFNDIFHSDKKVRGKKRNLQIKLSEFESRAYKIASDIHPFTFERFEKKYFRSHKAKNLVAYHYQEKIKQLESNGQISTASTYRLSLKSIQNYALSMGKNPDELSFLDFTGAFLEGYENYMIEHLHRSRTTVGIYMRSLRAVFNDAFSSGDIEKDIYPFGKGTNKYQIPSARGRKSALSNSQLTALFQAKPKTPEQQKAKDFWFLSYACNGMNIKDIALLKMKNLQGEEITYFRAKTLHTKKSDLVEIVVHLNEYSKSIIELYRTGIKGEDYLFPIVSALDSQKQKHRRIKNFTRFINQHINLLAKEVGFDFRISTYWARHSFATTSIRKGASMEFVSEALNHRSLKTTLNYFAGFEDDKKKEFAESLMDFGQ